MSVLTKNSSEYLSSRQEARQLHTVDVNRISLTLGPDMAVVTDSTKPEVRTTGNTVCFLT